MSVMPRRGMGVEICFFRLRKHFVCHVMPRRGMGVEIVAQAAIQYAEQSCPAGAWE